MREETAPRMADTFGLPCYYVTDVIREDAGDGNVRTWHCALKGGILVPACEVIVPAHRLLRIGRDASEFARELYERQQMTESMQSFGARH